MITSTNDKPGEFHYVSNAKDLLDRIGEKIYEEANKAAEDYKGKLHGNLSAAKLKGRNKIESGGAQLCRLDYNYHTNVTNGKSYPCRPGKGKRFSYEGRGKCYEEKIEGNVNNEGSNGGACAPYRRLNLCVKNLENINDVSKIDSKDNLLLEVLLAAQYEGESLRISHPQYQEANSSSQLCTMLARSFADIGDIIRGKDLYRGDSRTDKLEQNLKEIFGNIYNELTTSTKNRKTKGELQKRYQDDAKKNFFKLREDWWNTNRMQVWNAITCGAEGYEYFRPTCHAAKERTKTYDKCRCAGGTVPTYFDYVPQYLRWFEEWAEDFCTKRKHKLENAIRKCRDGLDENGEERYCDLNVYDCKGTAKGKNQFDYDHECIECSFSCDHFVHWIDKQKEEFNRQVKKYKGEMGKAETAITTEEKSNGNINNLYISEFYSKLHKDYSTVDKFLTKLNEGICKRTPSVKRENARHVDFNEDTNTTFSHTEYCQACPLCGVKKEKNSQGKWEAYPEDECRHEQNTNFDDTNNTAIKIMVKDEAGHTMMEKLRSLCSVPPGENIKKWKCHFQNSDNDYCVLQDEGKNEERKKIELFSSILWRWIARLLRDSMEWRKELKNCINNEKSTNCIRGCKNKCECYEKWVKRMQEEWESIEHHYDKQNDFQGLNPYFVLEQFLELVFLPKMKEDNKEVKSLMESVQEMEEIIQKIKTKETEPTKKNNAISKFIDHEKEIANRCTQTHNENKCKGENKKPSTSIEPSLRSENPDNNQQTIPKASSDNTENPKEDDHMDDPIEDDDIIEIPNVSKDELEDLNKESEESITEEVEKEDIPPLDVCEIVKGVLTGKDNLNDACKQKYGKTASSSWRCVTTTSKDGRSSGEGKGISERAEHARSKRAAGGEKSGSSGEKSDSSGDKNGGICIPPRRRRLYLHDLKTLGGDEATGGAENTPTQKQLLEWFVKSAAVETFFLWHNYKERWKLENGGDEVEGPKGGGFGAGTTSTVVGPFVTSHSEMRASSSLHPPAGPHPPTGGSLQPTPPLLPVPPGFPPGPQIPVPSPGVGLNGRSTSLLQDGSEHGYFGTGSGEDSGENQTPEQQLEKGKIPNDFLRQMFYTLADYRDICIGGDRDVVGDTIISNTSDKDANSSGEPKTVSKIIEDFLKKQPGDKATSGISTGSPSDKDPKTWWDKNAKHIWEGMVCALTYEDTEQKGGTPKQIDKVKEAFFGDKDNLENNGTTSGTFHKQYKYKTVELKDENDGTRPIPTGSSSPSGEKTTPLTQFVVRPTYFRYFEEWGTEFCGMRARLLEKIKGECRNSGKPGRQYCSGDGYDCEKITPDNYKNISDLDCRDCYKQCRKYRNWIDIKFEEYHNQEKKYDEERQKLTKDNNCSGSGGGGDNKEFCQQIKEKKKNSAAEFLKTLKHCKNDQGDEEKKSTDKDNEIDFSKPEKTFSRSTYCKTCPLKGVKCNGRGARSATNECKENGQKWNEVFDGIKDDNKTTSITVDMIDRRWPFIKNYSEKLQKSQNSLFKESRLFKGLRVQNWECKVTDENMNICKLKNFDENIDLNQHTTFKVFLEYWIQDFLFGYYILKNKKKLIELCTKKEENTCSDEKSKNDCACVNKWVTQKRQEWNQIKDASKNRNQEDDANNDIKSSVTQLLEQLQSLTEFKKVMQPCTELNDFLKSLGCTETYSSEYSKEDAIDCMIKNLETKIGECKAQPVQTSLPSGQTQPTCDDSSLSGGNTHPDDEEEEYENENTVAYPKICDEVLKKTETVEETGETCGEKDTQPDVKEEEEEKEEQQERESSDDGKKATEDAKDTEDKTPKGTEAPAEVPASAGRPEKSPKKENPSKKQPIQTKRKTNKRSLPPQQLSEPLRNAMLYNTLAWCIGIGITGLSYWFLKKKTKSSVDLLRVLQIPKSDYDIPTLKSSNRYIPYTSGKYRGKRYIYIEGDSGTDSGYTDHYSDITSSSESEYEELDINDIYVPGSPKYKTLIEVVLEPSKRETNSGDTIPTSDIPSPITDEEWNEFKQNFISTMLQSEQNTEPNDYTSGTTPTNTNNTTMSSHNVDEKPFIMSIHDRNLYTGEEISYDMTTNSGRNNLYSGIDPKRGDNVSYSGTKNPISDNHHPYSGIDLINDSLSGDHDIYDEILKRKENELFGTNHVKQTSTYSVAKNTSTDPILKQLDLYHKWLDRHRNMCEKWENKVDILNKLKELWENDTSTSGNKNSNIPSNIPSSDIQTSDIHSGKLSDIPSGNIHSDNIHSDTTLSSNKMLNSDFYIQIDMDNPEPINQFTNMDSILEDLDKTYNEPYYDVQDDIYYDVNDDDKTSMDNNNNLVHKNNPVDSNNTYNRLNPADINNNFVDKNNQNQHPIEKPTKIQIEMNSNNRKWSNSNIL
ncbi:erythrocyte membrane protein 1, PfEMP1, putative [Plasmodium reichenowi]|uniref:Erythrocyte membrane protein 1, PfEMP1, putative n=1 Tax=Plasmodium reichenowi TaxID=5854 RepID=A0A2P9D5X0_PLARE|nr:erythrocyte membrane protein 1, PfEMP1, putative [Plasmodium reichenowi]